MNRALLLVVCDFLLLSLLALVDFDRPPEQEEPPPQEAPEAQAQAEADLVEVLELSLEEEQLNREMLAEELREREEALAEREERLRQEMEEAQRIAQEKESVEEQRARLEQERQALAQELEQASEQMQQIQQAQQQATQQTAATQAELAAARERQRALQEQLQQREENLTETQQRLQALAEEREYAEKERAILATRLEAAAAEQERLQLEIGTLQEERQAVQEQAAELARGVTELAQGSDEIREEIRRAQPLTLNQIFSQYRDNRAPAAFEARVDAVFGSRTINERTRTLFVTDGAGVYAIFEASTTPFEPAQLGRLQSARGQIQIGNQIHPIGAVSFAQVDPRIVTVRVPREIVEAAGIKIFEITDEPFQFPQAVLITASGDKFAEWDFRVRPGSRKYVDVDSTLGSRLFGEFSPSRGDFVFSKSGALIGLMVTNSEAVIIDNLSPTAALSLGEQFSEEKADQLEDTFTGG